MMDGDREGNMVKEIITRFKMLSSYRICFFIHIWCNSLYFEVKSWMLNIFQVTMANCENLREIYADS